MGKTQRDFTPRPESLMPLLAPLQAVQILLDAFGERGVIIGGIAVGLLGELRFTADGVLPFEKEMVKRSQVVTLGGLKLRLPSPEDLIILKAVAHRPKDMLDIESMLLNQPGVDREYIRTWVQQFAQALEMPELWDDLATRLK